jgi:hypothetical protein
VVADFDRDGNSDVAALHNANGSNIPMVAVLRGSPTGHLGAPTSSSYPVTSGYYASGAAGDFDGDGDEDLMAGLGANALYFFEGVGDGTLVDGVTISNPQPVYRLVAGDFNADGKWDIAYQDSSYGASVWIRFGDGGGGFAAPVEIPIGSGLSEFAVADLNRDGIDDLLVANSSSNSISVITGVSYGAFGPAQNYPIGSAPTSVAVADWNGDGWLDLGATVQQQNTVSISFSTGTGGFSPAVPIDSSYSYSSRLTAGDFNGDGNPDFTVSGVYGVIYMFLGNGVGGFAASFIAGIVGEAAVADFNRDGLSDIASASRDVAILLGSPTGRFFEFHTVGGYTGAGPPVFGDFDGDGRQDVLAGDGASMRVLWNDPGGLAPSAQIQTTSDMPRAGGDFNGDGKADVVMSTSYPNNNEIAIYLAFGTRGFYRLGSFAVGTYPGEIVTADFNGDMKLDLAVVNTGSASVSILLGVGNGSFSTQTQFAVGSGPSGAAAGDLNGDLKADLAVLRGDGTLVLLTGNGTGGFSSISTLSIGANAGDLVLADLDGDHDLDVATTTAYGKTLTVLLGNGSGGFGTPSNLTNLEIEINSLAAGHVNGDTYVDLVAGWGGFFYSGGGAWVFLGDGTGAFTPSSRYFTGTGSILLAAGELEADGLTDFAVTMSASSLATLAVLRNTNCLARRLGVTVDVPECSTPNVSFSTQPVIEVLDDGDNLLSCETGAVNASIVPGTGAPGATLGGDATVDAVAGVATFTGLSIDIPGAAYELLFSHPSASMTRSRRFDQGSVSVSAPAQVCPYAVGLVASVPDAGPGSTYEWTLMNGAITGGAGTRAIHFKVGPSGQAVLSVVVTHPDACSVTGTRTITVAPGPGCPASAGFFTVPPCRVIDTRDAVGPHGGPALAGNTTRLVTVVNRCGIPPTAKSVALNLTVVAAPTNGYFTLFPGNSPVPLFSTLNFRPGLTRANNAIAPLGAAGDLAVFVSTDPSAMVDFIVDVSGYFE